MAKPTNLSGNQLQNVIEATPLGLRDVVRSVYHLLSDSFPGAVKTYDGENLGFGHGAGYKGLVFVITPKQTSVNLGFVRAVDLSDPAGLLEGTGKLHRHVKLRSIAEVDSQELRTLVQDAMKMRKP
ncbi:MAG: DUF1801 domain-containing protein [Acidobacteriota bacterium]|nr:DUF1801 domain-containing protein [Acidobacteriota bacterium]